MSIASLGIVGSMAGTQLPQRAAEADRTERQSVDQSRTTQADERAENAAGIGQTEEDSQTSERDADGRRLWEKRQGKTQDSPIAPPAADAAAVLSKDPSGACGNELDLVG
jgi:hypothetical protein